MSGTPKRLPHDSWAVHYERVMEGTFGSLYERLTTCTLAEVERLTPTDATVLDVGAGCGRMTVPLASSGRRVVAVERSSPMAEVLRTRTKALAPEIQERVEILEVPIQEMGRIEPVDLALSVFTVIAYTLTKEELTAAFSAAARVLRTEGALLLDVPDIEVFESVDVESGDLIREVSMTPLGDGLFDYRELTLVRTPDGPVRYEDAFRLRAWKPDEVVVLLRQAGFDRVEDVSERFPGLGARYLLARRGSISSTGVSD